MRYIACLVYYIQPLVMNLIQYVVACESHIYLLCNGSGQEGTSLLTVAKKPWSPSMLSELSLLVLPAGTFFSRSSIFSCNNSLAPETRCRAKILINKIMNRTLT
ncbi:hypothetical protein TorRG33x02_332390 [Trema orientale]|uniref:Uncharacterized protein n=1 Tax=Trema orientale TaxID=63057 RepID=A0A2P5B575_TREOI|nr:hypothetical protein TorRG33x02_332390 [Trema orientale]